MVTIKSPWPAPNKIVICYLPGSMTMKPQIIGRFRLRGFAHEPHKMELFLQWLAYRLGTSREKLEELRTRHDPIFDSTEIAWLEVDPLAANMTLDILSQKIAFMMGEHMGHTLDYDRIDDITDAVHDVFTWLNAHKEHESHDAETERGHGPRCCKPHHLGKIRQTTRLLRSGAVPCYVSAPKAAQELMDAEQKARDTIGFEQVTKVLQLLSLDDKKPTTEGALRYHILGVQVVELFKKIVDEMIRRLPFDPQAAQARAVTLQKKQWELAYEFVENNPLKIAPKTSFLAGLTLHDDTIRGHLLAQEAGWLINVVGPEGAAYINGLQREKKAREQARQKRLQAPKTDESCNEGKASDFDGEDGMSNTTGANDARNGTQNVGGKSRKKNRQRRVKR